MNKLIIIGCGGHAKTIIELISHSKKWEIYGLIGQTHEVGGKILGFKCIGDNNDLKSIYRDCKNAFIGIGQIKSPQKRIYIAQLLEELKFNMPIIFSKNAIISKFANIKKGSSIGHGSIVNANSKIGSFCIINSMALIEHDVVIGNFCHVSTGALINGGVEIGEGTFVGSGSIIREGLKIPPNSFIKAGTKVMGWPLKEN